MRKKPSSVDDSSIGGVNTLPFHSTTESFISLGETINFIDCWLKFYDRNCLDCSNMYIETMKSLFKKIPFQLAKPLSLKEKSNNYYMLLELIGTLKINQNLPNLKKRKLIKNHNR